VNQDEELMNLEADRKTGGGGSARQERQAGLAVEIRLA
jgi:hypothetical protein